MKYAEQSSKPRGSGSLSSSLGSEDKRQISNDSVPRSNSSSIHSERHERALVDLVMDLRGAPAPVAYDIDTTSYHYVTLEYLMPQIIQSVRTLIATYNAAGTTGLRRADALISQHVIDYNARLKALEKMHANLVA